MPPSTTAITARVHYFSAGVETEFEIACHDGMTLRQLRSKIQRRIGGWHADRMWTMCTNDMLNLMIPFDIHKRWCEGIAVDVFARNGILKVGVYRSSTRPSVWESTLKPAIHTVSSTVYQYTHDMAHAVYLIGKLVVASTYLVWLVTIASTVWCTRRVLQHGHIIVPYALAWLVLSATQVTAARSV